MNSEAAMVVAFDKHRGRTSRSENRLRSHTAKRPSQIGGLTALQQNDNNQEKANNDVQGCYQVNHCQLKV